MKKTYKEPTTSIYYTDIQNVMFSGSTEGILRGGGDLGNFEEENMTQEGRHQDIWDDEDE